MPETAEEFRTVGRGRRNGRLTTHATGAYTVAQLFHVSRPHGDPAADSVDGRRLNATLRALPPMREALRGCHAADVVLAAAAAQLPRGPAHLLCIGLGCPAQSRTAQWQLAFLWLLHHSMSAMGWELEATVHEPLLSATDRAVLQTWLPSLAVATVNVEAKLSIEQPTLAFLPHCPSTLCCNLLRSNWSPLLAHLVIVGNSFSTYLERAVTREKQRRLACIGQLLPHCVETRLDVRDDIDDWEAAFGDTSVHSFPAAALPASEDQLWAEPPPFPPPEHDVIGANPS
eukprot:GGOE01036970.1.p1 GENE.GGOE01036970.1~~GGOE01036970.1.p1  ORF type:complete len:286 (-),score=74.61 GGOE01036970.1:171-1028(-)